MKENPTITRLVELQADESDDKFAGRWLGISGTSWYRLKRGEYGAAPDKLLAKCEGGLRALEDYLEFRQKHGLTGEIIDLESIKDTIDAVRVAQAEPRNRLVVMLAPTGGGKSSTAAALQRRYPGRVSIVEATEPWRTSYLAATLAIAEAVGVRECSSSTRLAESALIKELQARPRILVIDEAHYFGPATINLIKAVLNQTQCTVLLLAIPALWRRMKQIAWEEAEQIRSRTAYTIEVLEVSAKDLDTFLRNRLPKIADIDGDFSAAKKSIRESCNRFGLWDTAERLCTEILDQAGNGRINLDIINSAIANISKLRR